MRKLKKGRKLSRPRAQRKSLRQGLAREVILRERVKTTEAKAKEVRPYLEKVITRSRKGDLASTRLLAHSFSKAVVRKLVREIGPRYKERPGGYTRIIKLGPRRPDGARMAIIELVK